MQTQSARGDPSLSPETILRFWFAETDPSLWFRHDPAFDRLVRERFATTLARARAGELAVWRDTAAGRLAEIIVLDQFSRNIHRGTAEAFAADAQALTLAQEAVGGGHDHAIELSRRPFVYMPYMHSESRQIQRESICLFDQQGLEASLVFARSHQSIIERFGRFPHRNAVLGRISTAEEEDFLAGPGSSF